MLTTGLIHPGILRALAGAGHGARVLLADANYPHSTGIGQRAELIHLNLTPGVVDAVTVLRALTSVAQFEAASVMVPPDGDVPPIGGEFAAVLGLPLSTLGRSEFYAAARSDDVALAIATGEQRLYGNLLLTVGAWTG
ncbi:RbsD/FucU family protein [Arthrobacter sp. 92]|uniref:RbsD/FucU family protein n=1 Tax=Arthrobacter sp. 92 TaxID=3418175 RepID=UPI003CFFA502